MAASRPRLQLNPYPRKVKTGQGGGSADKGLALKVWGPEGVGVLRTHIKPKPVWRPPPGSVDKDPSLGKQSSPNQKAMGSARALLSKSEENGQRTQPDVSLGLPMCTHTHKTLKWTRHPGWGSARAVELAGRIWLCSGWVHSSRSKHPCPPRLSTEAVHS